jgi:hypothetical protein
LEKKVMKERSFELKKVCGEKLVGKKVGRGKK